MVALFAGSSSPDAGRAIRACPASQAAAAEESLVHRQNGEESRGRLCGLAREFREPPYTLPIHQIERGLRVGRLWNKSA
jgi:hypothetical protein